MNCTEKLEQCYNSLKGMTDFKPDTVIVLGSGLGDFAKRIDVREVIDYSKIEGFPVSTVSGHAGKLIFGYIGKTKVAAMQGRVHYYEGNAMTDVVLPLRVLRKLGAEKLLLTNAAGGINLDFRAGDFMLITDHIASFVPSPLIGENIGSLGVRFPDMTEVYDKKLREKVKTAAKELGIDLKEGVYIQMTGPQYETPTEIKLYRTFGADAVGMSTACEAIAARHAGYRICGISFISNAAAGISGAPLTHEEVKEAADRAAESFADLVESFIMNIND